MLIPPPVLRMEARKAAIAGQPEAASPPKDIVGPLVHMTKERVAHQGSQTFLGLALEADPQQQQQEQQQQQQ